MKNQELAKIFYEIADYLEIEGVAFRPLAYQKAALMLESMEQSVKNIHEKGGINALKEIPGVGENIAQKIEEYLKTGKVKTLLDLKKKFPFNLKELTSVEGLGPRKAAMLYQKLKIKNLKDLEASAKKHKISSLFGFGEKTEKNILEGIAFVKKSGGRFLLGEIIPAVKEVLAKLQALKEVKKASVAGSVRRAKETVGDVDILVVSKNPVKVMDFFTALPGVIKIWGKGTTKSSVRMEDGFDMDLRVVPEKSYGSALQYFTGSKEHNIITRRMAIERGLRLNEYGIFKGSKMIAGMTEKEVYKSIGLAWIPPEIRENNGEIEAALAGTLPKLVELIDINGDLHCHSNWDGGENSIEEMAKTAMDMGYEYIGISDHTKFLRIENGLNEKQLLEQRKEIKTLNSKSYILNSGFRILQGCEANILNDGLVDIKDEVLKQLDYVIAGVHSNMKMDKKQMTERIIKAMRNSNIDIISHPTGRLLKKRDEYQIDFAKILKVAKETGTILEINSWPERLDLKDSYIKMAKQAGVKMIINTDAHHKDQMKVMEFGVAQACRGWAEKEDIINTQPLNKLLEFFK